MTTAYATMTCVCCGGATEWPRHYTTGAKYPRCSGCRRYCQKPAGGGACMKPEAQQ